MNIFKKENANIITFGKLPDIINNLDWIITLNSNGIIGGNCSKEQKLKHEKELRLELNKCKNTWPQENTMLENALNDIVNVLAKCQVSNATFDKEEVNYIYLARIQCICLLKYSSLDYVPSQLKEYIEFYNNQLSAQKKCLLLEKKNYELLCNDNTVLQEVILQSKLNIDCINGYINMINNEIDYLKEIKESSVPEEVNEPELECQDEPLGEEPGVQMNPQESSVPEEVNEPELECQDEPLEEEPGVQMNPCTIKENKPSFKFDSILGLKKKFISDKNKNQEQLTYILNSVKGKSVDSKRLKVLTWNKVRFANGLVTFTDKTGLYYLGMEKNLTDKGNNISYNNADNQAIYLSACSSIVYKLFNQSLNDEEMISTNIKEIVPYYKCMMEVFEKFLMNQDTEINLQSIMDFKKYYNELIIEIDTVRKNEKVLWHKAMNIADDITNLSILFGYEKEEKYTAMLKYTEDILHNSSIETYQILNKIKQNDIANDVIANLIGQLEYLTQNIDKVKESEFIFVGEHKKVDTNQEVLPFRESNIRFVIRIGKLNQPTETIHYQQNEYNKVIELYRSSNVHIKDLGIEYQGENIFLVRYNKDFDKTMLKLSRTEKHVKRYDKGKIAEIIEYYEMKLLKELEG